MCVQHLLMRHVVWKRDVFDVHLTLANACAGTEEKIESLLFWFISGKSGAARFHREHVSLCYQCYLVFFVRFPDSIWFKLTERNLWRFGTLDGRCATLSGSCFHEWLRDVSALSFGTLILFPSTQDFLRAPWAPWSSMFKSDQWIGGKCACL